MDWNYKIKPPSNTPLLMAIENIEKGSRIVDFGYYTDGHWYRFNMGGVPVSEEYFEVYAWTTWVDAPPRDIEFRPK